MHCDSGTSNAALRTVAGAHQHDGAQSKRESLKSETLARLLAYNNDKLVQTNAMIKKPCYFRSENYLYHIRTQPSYYFCVGASKSMQALWGIIGETVHLISFSITGDLLDVKSFGWNDFNSSIDEKSYDSLIWAASLRFVKEYDLESDTISVKRFWIENLNAGVEDVSDTIKEMIQSPEIFDSVELADCTESFEAWKQEDQYVFWWEQNYYMSKDGDVETS